MHTRIRKFNTRDTYPEQKLDNDLCQTWWPGATVFVRGQWARISTPRQRRRGDAEAQAEKPCQHQAASVRGRRPAGTHLQMTIYLTSEFASRCTASSSMAEGRLPGLTGIVVGTGTSGMAGGVDGSPGYPTQPRTLKRTSCDIFSVARSSGASCSGCHRIVVAAVRRSPARAGAGVCDAEHHRSPLGPQILRTLARAAADAALALA